MYINVAVLTGGDSSEREISLKSAEEIIKYINKDKYNITVITVPKTKSYFWIKKLIEFSPDIVFNLLHGGDGENGSAAGLLNWLNVPYIGNSVLSGAVCSNKKICKEILKHKGVPVCEDVFIKKDEEASDYQNKIKELGFPVIIKPNNGGGSIGITIEEDIDKSIKAIKKIITDYNDDVLVEKFIAGREAACVVTKTSSKLNIMSILDISTDRRFYDYDEKYISDTVKINFSALPEFIQEMIKDIAGKVFTSLECTGLCCVDLIVSEEQVYFIEANTIPGFTSQSILTRILKASNTNIEEFIDNLIKDALTFNE